VVKAIEGVLAAGSYVDIPGNRVVLEVPVEHVEQARAALASLSRKPVAVEIATGSVQDDGLRKDQPLGFGLVEGGQAIGRSATQPICTSAFAVYNGYGPFILTAGHCALGLGPETWSQGGSRLGTLAARNVSGTYDAALISTHGARAIVGRYHRTYDDFAAPVTFAVTSHNLVGQTVCQSGMRTTGLTGNANLTARCGTVQTVAYRPIVPGYTYTAASGRATYRACSGDSGSAVVWPTIYGYGGAGIHKGSNKPPGETCSNDAFFTRLPVVMNAWGLTLQPF
jgi:hypothetical protein